MKTKTTCFNAVLAGLLALLLFTPAGNAQQPGPVPVVITSRGLQYKVVDMSQIIMSGNQSAAGTLETLLNNLGAQGWKVVSTYGSLLILSR